MVMAFFPGRAMESQLAKSWDSLTVSRRDLVARPRAAEASQWAGVSIVLGAIAVILARTGGAERAALPDQQPVVPLSR